MRPGAERSAATSAPGAAGHALGVRLRAGAPVGVSPSRGLGVCLPEFEEDAFQEGQRGSEFPCSVPGSCPVPVPGQAARSLQPPGFGVMAGTSGAAGVALLIIIFNCPPGNPRK